MTLQVPELEDGGPGPVSIGGRAIDVRSGPLVIAEAGVNHDGRVDRAVALVDAAREAGADAVKFQVFRAAELVGAGAVTADYQRAAGSGPSQLEMLAKLELRPDDFARVARHSREAGLLFLATPFGTTEVSRVCDLGCPAIKIASTDLDNLPLLQAAGCCGRPILLSTGASTIEEIDQAVDWLDQLDAGERLVLMHCVSAYPTASQDAALATIAHLQQRYGRWVGFSDHTLEEDSGALAVACGAKVLEKHLTLDREAQGPDHAMSLEPEQFGHYVRAAQRAWSMLGRPRRAVAQVEQDVRRASRRSVVARSDIPAGDLLTPENLTLKRPAGGLSPAQWTRLIGRRAARSIAADTPISWEMLT